MSEKCKFCGAVQYRNPTTMEWCEAWECGTYLHDSGLGHLGIEKELRQSDRCKLAATQAENAVLRQRVESAHREAATIAENLCDRHFKHESPDWCVSDDLVTVILQVSNMAAGIEDRLTTANATIAALRESLHQEHLYWEVAADISSNPTIANECIDRAARIAAALAAATGDERPAHHSSDVQVFLHVGSKAFPVARTGPTYVGLREPVNLELPCEAMLEFIIDGRATTHELRLLSQNAELIEVEPVSNLESVPIDPRIQADSHRTWIFCLSNVGR